MSTRDGVPVVKFRLVHKFGRSVINVNVKLWWRRSILTAEGERYFKFEELPNVEPQGAFTLAPFNFVHTVDERSPMYGMFDADVKEEEEVDSKNG